MDVRGEGGKRRGWWLAGQVLLIVAAVLAYFGVRGLTEGNVQQAEHNAQRIVELQRALRIDWEESLQRLIIDSDAVVTLLNWIYIYGHWPAITAVLLWLALRHPEVFRRTRDAMLASGGAGLVVFATFPVAPPRLLPGMDVVDTITERSVSYRVLQPPAFTNQYAALPSLHVGWNLLLGLAIFAAATHLLLRVLAVVLPVAMNAAVVLTANHYLLDLLAGLAFALIAWALAGWWSGRRRSRAALTARPDPLPAAAR